MHRNKLLYLNSTYLPRDEKYLMRRLLKQYRNFDSDCCSLLKSLGNLTFQDFTLTVRPYKLFIMGVRVKTDISRLIISIIHSKKILPEELKLLAIIRKNWVLISYQLPPVIWCQISYKLYSIGHHLTI